MVAVIAAPLLEELLFRAPITLFQNKKYFKIVFYTFALVFGFIHLSNFEITRDNLIISGLVPMIVRTFNLLMILSL